MAGNTIGTNLVDINSILARHSWLDEGLLQRSSTSFFNRYTGSTSDSVIHNVSDPSAGKGHEVRIDYDGKIVGQAYKGETTAYGKGESKRKFSSSIRVDRYRIPVNNGDSFNGVNVDDLSNHAHTDSRTKLADVMIRLKDQYCFDVAQSAKAGSVTPSHSYTFDATSAKISIQDLASLEYTLKTGQGFMNGATVGTTTAATVSRGPLPPYRLSDGRAFWILVIDAKTALNIRQNTDANQGIVPLSASADMRGESNRVFTGMIGQIGQLIIVEAPSFHGSNSAGMAFENIKCELSGMRHYDLSNTAWEGEDDYASAEYSRNFILGENAMQMAWGKHPEYHHQWSNDFKINSESAVEYWVNVQKTRLLAENDDYDMDKRAGMDNAVIPFDVRYT